MTASPGRPSGSSGRGERADGGQPAGEADQRRPVGDRHRQVVDDVALRVTARTQPRTGRRLLTLVAQGVALTRDADRTLFALTVVLQLGGAAILALQVVVVRLVLDRILDVTGGGSPGSVLVPVVLLAALNAAVAVTTAARGNVQRVLGELVVRSTWARVLDVASEVELLAYESADFFDRLQRVQTSALSRPYQLTQGLVGMVGGIAGGVALGVAVVAIEPLLLPLLLLAGVPMLITSRRESRLEFDFSVAQTPRLRLRQYLAVVLTGRDEAKEVRAFGLSDALRAQFDGHYADYVRDLRAHVGRRTRLAMAGNLAAAILLALTLLAVVWLVARGRVDLPGAGAAIVAVRLLASQVGTVLSGGQQVYESGLFLDDLDAFVRMAPAARARTSGRPAPADFDQVRVDRVTFTYPGGHEPALREVSMVVGAGEVVALVGENGSGKTTLAMVLAGLHDPSSGRVLWDGQDTRAFDRASLRDRVSVIFQDFVHYHMSAAHNVGLGRPSRMDDRAAIVQAARRAGADDAISSLPDGYDTVLSKVFAGGQDLSGGQWQRVALARAFFRDAPFVILDEPTSALDPRAEHRLFTSLRSLLAGRTVLFVSHRFATVRSADRIVVLDRGQVAEQGTHDELMTADGRYAELFRLQAAAYLDGDA